MRIEMPTAELLQQAARMVTTPGVGMTPSQIEAEIAAGRLQPQWSQVAFDGEGSIVGRALGSVALTCIFRRGSLAAVEASWPLARG